MKERLTKTKIAKLEDEIDASEGTASLADTEGTLPLGSYLESRESDFVWWRDVKRTDV
ncbi:MAG: hypothetical protein Q7J73_11045 [Dehalococcoidales bacterium]|nr:hypothetical protein [Dehalococcoidales bacterium]